jgi:hypothetical protein
MCDDLGTKCSPTTSYNPQGLYRCGRKVLKRDRFLYYVSCVRSIDCRQPCLIFRDFSFVEVRLVL